MLEEVISLLEGEIEGKDMRIVIDCPETAPPEITQDRGALTQVIYILTGNSVKYSRKGCIRIGVAYNIDEEQLIIWVKDEGIGIPGPEHKLLFRMYGNSLNTEFGTGIGIYIYIYIVYCIYRADIL